MLFLTRDALKLLGLLIAVLVCVNAVEASDPVVEIADISGEASPAPMPLHAHPAEPTDVAGLEKKLQQMQEKLEQEKARSTTLREHSENARKQLEEEKAKSKQLLKMVEGINPKNPGL